MKFAKKLFTILPLSIGISSPIAISGCSKKASLTLSFGDTINCLSGKETGTRVANFWGKDSVADASREHIQYAIKDGDTLVWSNTDNTIQQQFYWDLVHSCAKEKEYMLRWNCKTGAETSKKLLDYGEYWLDSTKDPEKFKSIRYERNSTDNKYHIILVKEDLTEIDACKSETYTKI